MHLRVEPNRCGQPHCPICRREQAARKTSRHDIAGLAIVAGAGLLLLILLVLVIAFPR